ncbi:MAG: hypothetical protein Q9182_006796 [Xanthomendoza sp. 2 TL-2023]
MGKPPAIIIIARYVSSHHVETLTCSHKRSHGARLDAADKQWHLTSPTPYDPPLTYGGWVQSQALGNRIGGILQDSYPSSERAPLDKSSNIIGDGPPNEAADRQNGYSGLMRNGGYNKRRKHKIIIHSSPFLRCIQTSIAISAGIAQSNGPTPANGQLGPPKHHPMHSEAQHPTHPASPHLTGMDTRTTSHLSAIPEPGGSGDGPTEHKEQPADQHNPCLRIDAFLGEWLSPEYFDMITPPPNSVMMLTSAKAELMRPGDYVDVSADSYKTRSGKGNFPGGWGSNSAEKVDVSSLDDSGPLSTVSTVRANLPRLNRASSHSNINDPNPSNNNRTSPGGVSTIETSKNIGKAEYVPPTPSYAISPSDPIPPGYVAHARDNCMEVNFQWDSMRQPHDWGSGGDYGEEWSGMHKRFRRGLQSMITWYQHNHAEVTTQDILDGSSSKSDGLKETDADTDTVLILVTHGAGCNALIGALTNQPALLDVGMSSLTMAVRKDTSEEQVQSPTSPKQSSRPQSSVDSGVFNEYDVRVTASTDHLHARSRSSTAGLQHYSPSLWSTHRYRTNSAGSTTSSGSFTDGEFGLDSENRTMISIGSGGLPRSMTSSGGLWSKPVVRSLEGTIDRLHREKTPVLAGRSPLIKELSTVSPVSKKASITEEAHGPDEKTNGAPGHPTTQQGLWGAPPTTSVNEREMGPKRRWTHSEQR